LVIRRAFYREAARTILAAAALLLVLFVFLGLTQLLGQAAAGKYPRDVIFTLLGLELVNNLTVLIPLATYVGILMTLARWYRDSEMTVLAACGIGLWSILRPVMQLATFFALLTTVLALYLSPLATARIERVKTEGQNRAQLMIAQPGLFTELHAPGRILFVERIGKDGVLRHIFANDRKAAKQNILVADSGREIRADDGEILLVLKDGSMYEGLPGAPDYRIVDFQKYTLRLEPPEAEAQSTRVDSLSTLALVRSTNPRQVAELHWRLAKPVSLLVLAAFALVLAHTDARRGRLGNLLAAILVYFTYSNLIGIGELLLKGGRLPTAIGLWWVHGALAAVVVFLLVRRAWNKPLLPISGMITRWR
jgi:lipopolysaccharide export system permease protein